MKKFIYSSLTTVSMAALFSCSSRTPDTTLTGAIKEWSAGQDDSKDRIVLRNATHAAAVNGTQKEHEADLLFALENSTSNKVKVFLIHELKLIGGVASIKPLSKYLLDDELCSHTTQALLRINNSVGGDGEGLFSEFTVLDALSEVLPKAKGNNLIYIVKTLGSLKNCDQRTLEILYALTENGDKTLKFTALRAVAEQGNEYSSEVMLDALHGETQYNRSKVISLNLLYARNLDAGDGVSHTLKVMSMVDKMKEDHLFIKCLSTLQDLKGDNFTDDLISYLDDENLRIAFAVVNLLNVSTDSSINAKLTADFSNKKPAFQAQALKVLVHRKAPKAGFLTGKCLESADQYVRQTAAILSSESKAEDVVDGLLLLIGKGTPEDKKYAATALSRFTAKELAGSLIKAYNKGDNSTKSLLLSIMASKKESSLADTALQATLSSDDGVKRTALKALKNIAGFSQVGKIVTLMSNTEDSSSLKGFQGALVNASTGKENETAAEILKNIKKGSSAKSNLSMIQVLPRIGGSTAFNGLLDLSSNGAESVQKEAIRSIAKWNSLEQFSQLLNFTGNIDGSNRILLIRGISSLIVNSEGTNDKKKDMLKKLSTLAPNDSEKAKLVDQMNKLK